MFVQDYADSVGATSNQRQMRLAECAFGIPHDLSGRDQEVAPTEESKSMLNTLVAIEKSDYKPLLQEKDQSEKLGKDHIQGSITR